MTDYDDQNVFAKILRGEMPCIKLYEDAHTLAFMDVMPQADGHALVIPKKPACDMLDLDEESAGQLIATVQKIAYAVKKGMGCAGVMLAQLNGPAAGQTVFHTHFHIIPRHDGIDMKIHARDMEDATVLEANAEKIRAALAP